MMATMLLRISTLLCFLGIALVAEGRAHAQPGTQTYAPVPPPAPVQLQLSTEDLEILDRGHISTGQYVAGGILGSYMGFGLGHVVQQRWSSKGWIFTAGESAGIAVLTYGVLSCAVTDSSDDSRVHRTWDGDSDCPWGLALAGGLAYAGFRVWEILDLWAGPPEHNRRLRRLQSGQRRQPYRFTLLPTGGDSGVATFSLEF